jgi:hypothetical protein
MQFLQKNDVCEKHVTFLRTNNTWHKPWTPILYRTGKRFDVAYHRGENVRYNAMASPGLDWRQDRIKWLGQKNEHKILTSKVIDLKFTEMKFHKIIYIFTKTPCKMRKHMKKYYTFIFTNKIYIIFLRKNLGKHLIQQI